MINGAAFDHRKRHPGTDEIENHSIE